MEEIQNSEQEKQKKSWILESYTTYSWRGRSCQNFFTLIYEHKVLSIQIQMRILKNVTSSILAVLKETIGKNILVKF